MCIGSVIHAEKPETVSDVYEGVPGSDKLGDLLLIEIQTPHRVSWQRASKCRRPHAMIGSTAFYLMEYFPKLIDLVSLHLHLLHLVVVLDPGASYNRKPIAAK